MSTGTLEQAPARSTTRTRTPGRTQGGSQGKAQPRAGQRTRPSAARQARTRTEEVRAAGTAPFVLLIMVLLTTGLVATLWLSTAAAADSYRLDSARQVARDLSEQTERLHRDVESARSAPALAAAAQHQGLVPAGEPAILLVAPDGSSRVIGEPHPARAASTGPVAGLPQPPPRPVARPAAPAAPVIDPEAATQTPDDQLAPDGAHG